MRLNDEFHHSCVRESMGDFRPVGDVIAPGTLTTQVAKVRLRHANGDSLIWPSKQRETHPQAASITVTGACRRRWKLRNQKQPREPKLRHQ